MSDFPSPEKSPAVAALTFSVAAVLVAVSITSVAMARY
jgi:hypothetical protein